MSDAFLDRLAPPERERVMKRLRSPEAYERLRERVKGPEDLERELARADRIAELHFALESEPQTHDRMKAIVDRALGEGGTESVTERRDLPDDAANALREGRFRLAVSPEDDALTILPEGNVQETIPVTTALLEECLSRLPRSA